MLRPAPVNPVWPVTPDDEISSHRSSPRPASPLPDPVPEHVDDPLQPSVTSKRNKMVL